MCRARARVWHLVVVASEYAKTWVAVATTVLVGVQAALTDGGVSTQEWVTVGLAALSTLGVYLWPNTTPTTPSTHGQHERTPT